MDESIGWLGLDGHSRQCTLGWTDDDGAERGCVSVLTEAQALIAAVKAIPKAHKHLMLEECELSQWIATVLRPYVDSLVVCDPRHNYYVSRHHNKRDDRDAYSLARLRRLGEYREVWHPTDARQVAFRHAASAYEDAVRHQTRLKLQIKSESRQWGVIQTGSAIFGRQRKEHLEKLPEAARRLVEMLYELLDSALKVEKLARRNLSEQGQMFPAVALLRKVPGVGLVGAHLFVAYVMEPKRFESDSRFIRYCQLGIRDCTSDGKPLGYQRLDRAGNSTLKAISYRAWLTAMRRRMGPVWEFFQQSSKRTGSQVHGRLNTQRKILCTMRHLWIKQQEFSAERFFSSHPSKV